MGRLNHIAEVLGAIRKRSLASLWGETMLTHIGGFWTSCPDVSEVGLFALFRDDHRVDPSRGGRILHWLLMLFLHSSFANIADHEYSETDHEGDHGRGFRNRHRQFLAQRVKRCRVFRIPGTVEKPERVRIFG